MNIILIIFSISLVICFGYITYIGLKFQVSSISASYYEFEKQKKGKGILFWIWSFLVPFSLLPCWLEISDDKYRFVAFLSAVSLLAVGCFPKYKEGDNLKHTLFTLFCCTLAIIWSILSNFGFIAISFLAFAIFISLSKAKGDFNKLISTNILYLCEIAAFSSIYLSIFIKLLC